MRPVARLLERLQQRVRGARAQLLGAPDDRRRAPSPRAGGTRRARGRAHAPGRSRGPASRGFAGRSARARRAHARGGRRQGAAVARHRPWARRGRTPSTGRTLRGRLARVARRRAPARARAPPAPSRPRRARRTGTRGAPAPGRALSRGSPSPSPARGGRAGGGPASPDSYLPGGGRARVTGRGGGGCEPLDNSIGAMRATPCRVFAHSPGGTHRSRWRTSSTRSQRGTCSRTPSTRPGPTGRFRGRRCSTTHGSTSPPRSASCVPHGAPCTRRGPRGPHALLANAWDEEHGEQNHAELWLRFAEALGLSRAEADGCGTTRRPRLSSTPTATWRRRRRSPPVSRRLCVRVAAARGRCREIEGLERHYDFLTPDRGGGVAFFEVHRTIDVAHAAAERQVLEDAVRQGLGEAALVGPGGPSWPGGTSWSAFVPAEACAAE